MCDTTLGNEEFFTENTLTIYPNPSHGIFQLTLSNTQLADGKLEVYDTLGKKVYKTINIKQHTQIDLSNLSKGIYFLKVYNGTAVYTKKIIIE